MTYDPYSPPPQPPHPQQGSYPEEYRRPAPRRPSILVPLILLGLGASVPGAQSGAAWEIRGRVLADGNGAALPRVQVTAAGLEPAFTDDRGQFVMSVPPTVPRAVRLQVEKAGFAKATFDAVREGASRREIVIPLARGAALTGRVVNVGGGPIVSAVVIVRPAPPADARRPIAPAPVAVLTDDLGEYRAGGLPEGRYAVQVADEPQVSAADLSMSLETGIGSTAMRDRLSELKSG